MNKNDIEIARSDLDDETFQVMEDAISDQEILLLKLKTQVAVKTKIADMKAKTAALNKQLPSASIPDESQTAKKSRIESENIGGDIVSKPEVSDIMWSDSDIEGDEYDVLARYTRAADKKNTKTKK